MAVKARDQVTVAVAVDVASVDNYYKLQSSTATPPTKPTTANPSGWSTTEPTYDGTSTNTLYICQKTTLTDGTFYWSAVSKSTSYEAAKTAYNLANSTSEALDNLEIGGRNLLKFTGKPTIQGYNDASQVVDERTGWSKWGSSTGSLERTSDGVKITIGSAPNGIIVPLAYENALADGGDFVLSFDYKTDHTTWGPLYFLYHAGGNMYLSTESWSPTVASTDEWMHHSVCIHINAYTGSSSGYGILLPYIAAGSRWYEIRDGSMKLEKGNKATDWTPAPEDVDAEVNSKADKTDGVEYISGTQTAATGTWTGVTKDSELYDGKAIVYRLPVAGSGDASLVLTLSGGTDTDAIPIFHYYSTSSNTSTIQRVTTHYPAGSSVLMTYDATNVRWLISNYNTNVNQIDRIQHSNNLHSASANNTGKTYVVTASSVIGYVDTLSGYQTIVVGSVIDLSKPILWGTGNVSTKKTFTNAYETYPSCTLRNNVSGWTGTQYGTAYLRGTVNGQNMTVESITSTIPSVEDGYVYLPLGELYSTYQIAFRSSSKLYVYKDGAFGPTSIREASAAAKTATNYLTNIDNDGLFIHRSADQTSGLKLTDVVDIIRDGTSVGQYGEEARIGRVDGTATYIGDGVLKFSGYGADVMLMEASGSDTIINYGTVVHVYTRSTNINSLWDIDISSQLDDKHYVGDITTPYDTLEEGVDYWLVYSGRRLIVRGGIDEVHVNFVGRTRPEHISVTFDIYDGVGSNASNALIRARSEYDSSTDNTEQHIYIGRNDSAHLSMGDLSSGNMAVLTSDDILLRGYSSIEMFTDDVTFTNNSASISETISMANLIKMLTKDSSSCSVETGASSIAINVVERSGCVVSVTLATIKLASNLSVNGAVNIATVPSGYRPSHNLYFPFMVYNQSSVFGYARINSSGVVQVRNTSSSAITTSAELCFTATYVI